MGEGVVRLRRARGTWGFKEEIPSSSPVTETEGQVASKKPSDGQTPGGPSGRKQDQLPAFPIMASSGLAEGLGRESCLNRLLLIEIR